jgi:hypothetical protein
MADTMNKNLRGFMQIAPEYVRPISDDGSKLRRLLGETERMSYEDALQATIASMREPTP